MKKPYAATKRLVCGVVVILAIVVSCGSRTAMAEEIVVGQATATSLTFGPVFAAIELGSFKQENLELEFRNFQGASVLIPQIINKSVTIGFPEPSLLIISNQPDRDRMPVQFFFNAARQSIWEFLVLEDSPIKSLSDLRGGKKIGVGALANTHVVVTRAMLAELDLALTRDYSFLAIGVGGPAFRAVLNHEIDVYNTFDTNIAAFEATGIKLRRLEQPQKYRDLFSNGFVAHTDTIKEKPEVVAGFGRAFTKGVVVCETNPDFCVRSFYKHNPTLKPRGLSDKEILARGLHILLSRPKNYLAVPAGGPRHFGNIPNNPGRILWSRSIKEANSSLPTSMYLGSIRIRSFWSSTSSTSQHFASGRPVSN